MRGRPGIPAPASQRMETETVTLLVDSVILIDHFSGTGAVRDTLAAGGMEALRSPT